MLTFLFTQVMNRVLLGERLGEFDPFIYLPPMQTFITLYTTSPDSLPCSTHNYYSIKSCYLTINIIIGPDDLLAKISYMAVFFGRTVWNL